MKNNSNIFLQFDFQTKNGATNAPLLFSNPKEIITTSRLDEVEYCLDKIDNATKDGCYTAGYFSYEIIYALENNLHLHKTNKMPLLWFGVFDTPVNQAIQREMRPYHVGRWEMQESQQTYSENFKKIMSAIHSGETEQINYTVPFRADFSGDHYAYYEQIKEAQSARFPAYLNIGEFAILSASPELFFQLDGGKVSVRPMKGTIHRGKTYEEDIRLRDWLASSEKNKLENRLIIEFMEEEIKNIVHSGTVQRIDPYQVEKYPTVYQMTSGLTGRMLPGLSAIDVLKSLFPCGSIAGVPKDTGLQLIHELEDNPREVYCGAIGYITPEQDAVFNVPIRTVWIDHQSKTAHYGAGGAITKNSICDEEYQEVLTKTNILTWEKPKFELLETIGLYDGEYIVLQEHLNRLQRSAQYFDIPINLNRIQDKLDATKQEHSLGKWRVRLTVNGYGEGLTCVPLTENGVQVIQLAERPIDTGNLYLYHKTTYREFYETYKHHAVDVLDVLLWNESGEITECTIGNIVVELNGKLYTPPVSSGLLPGTFRAHLLKEGVIREHVILKNDLEQCTKLWLINSVRKWVEVNLIK